MSKPWEYDAAQNDPLTELRIPVVETIRPWHFYLVALCINDDPETPMWHGLRPDEHETKLVQSLIQYRRSDYREGWVTREFDTKPFDIDGTANSITLIKRGENDWAYRCDTWEFGPALVPDTWQGAEEPLDLRGLLDRINGWGAKGSEPNPKWEQWKARRPEVFDV